MARSLHADLTTAQTSGYPTGVYQPAVQCILTSKDGGTTYDYSFDPTVIGNRLLHAQQMEYKESDSGLVLVDNHDLVVPSNLVGYYVDLGWGHNTASGVRYASSDGAVAPRLWVMKQTEVSGGNKNSRPQIYTLFQLAGVWSAVLDVQPMRVGTVAPYYQDEAGVLAGSTIYTILEYLIETTLSAQTGLTFTLDPIGTQDDSLISTIIPYAIKTAPNVVADTIYRILTVGTTDWTLVGAEANTIGLKFTATGAGVGNGTATFSIFDINPDSTSPSEESVNETYGSYIKGLLKMTKCYLRPEPGLAFKVVYPQSGDAVNETYYSSYASGIPFYEVQHTRLNVTPNRVEVYGGTADPPTVVGYYYDSDHYTAVTGGSFVVGTVYWIVTVGSTDFTLIGASANTVGVRFTATGAGSGTGTANYYSGPFMPVPYTAWFDGLTTDAECETRANELGRQLKDKVLGQRLLLPMDARVELFDREEINDQRGH